MAQVQIYFGSQTGTAECFSEEICEEAQQQGIECEVLDLQTFSPDIFAAKQIVVLVVSTYGEGEPSDNAVQFNKWASDPRNDGALKGQRFCVMGLGDMNYSKFNNMGQMTDQNLERLGGKRIYRRGVGDDSQDIAADFKEWKDGGLWAALQQAIAEVMAETGGAGFAAANDADAAAAQAAAAAAAAAAAKPAELHVFYAHDDEADGAAKDVCEAVVDELKSLGATVPAVHSLADRKSVEFVKKLPKRAVAVVIADCGPDGICSAGKKLVRNMSLEMDSKALSDKNLLLSYLAVASSKCNNSASSLREQIIAQSSGIPKAFERAGVEPSPVGEGMRTYVDAGVESMEPVVKQLTACLDALAKSRSSGAAAAAKSGGYPADAGAAGPAAKAKKTRILCAGEEAREAAEALSSAWPGGGCEPTEDASLASLASAAQEHAQVVLAVECGEGGLSDVARGLASQLNAAPIAIRASLRQMRFGLLVVASTHYGNAGERASANAVLAELASAAAPITQALQKFGAGCIASTSVDLQDASSDQLVEVANKLKQGFAASGGGPAGTANGTSLAAAPAAAKAQSGAPVAPELKMAPTAAGLSQEAPGEASDVLARFYFDADKTKVMKVRELRQAPMPDDGLATAEIELEASGNLAKYTLGGTLSLLPESDPEDVKAAVQLMGLTSADLTKWISFAAPAGSSPGTNIKKPFPTPCTLGDALAKYCDLSRAPTKKMLSVVQAKLEGEAKDRIMKLLADPEALKLLQDHKVCCRMHEFWSMIGVKSINICDFLVNCPRQKPREFTIASSPKAAPQRITLCVSLTSHVLPDIAAPFQPLIDAGIFQSDSSSIPSGRGRFFGACSRWLTTRLKSGDIVLAKQRPSPLHLPEKDVPIVMVGSGAGVAPFRGFWDELRRGPQTAPAALFFGCRNAEQDWLFKEEMSSAVKLAASSGCAALQRMQVGPKRPLACLFTAFSRPGGGKEGQYVQDQIRAQSASVKHWIENMSGAVYICGSTAMGNGVLEAIAESIEGGKESVDKLRKEGRIVAEMWG